MKLNEISKEVFHRKLADPAAQELVDIAKDLDKSLYPMRFHPHGEDKESAMIECVAPWYDEGEYSGHLEGVNIVTSVRRRISDSNYWVWDTWEGDADDTAYCYMIRKT